MDISIWLSDKLRSPECWKPFAQFLQQIADRAAVGAARYERGRGPERENRYMTRLLTEVREYKKTGNRECLLNIAVYCWLETMAPENPKFHWDDKAPSATRGKIEGVLK